MSTFARGALAGVAVSAAIGASLVAFTPTSFRGTPALAKEKGDLWHEHAADAAPAQPALAKGFSPLPSVAPLVKGLKPAVVSVSTANVLRARRRGPGQDPFDEFFRHFLGEGQRPDGNGDRVMPRGMGSGFVIHESGLVLTNNHVIDGADQITVKLADGREFRASVVGRDPKTDVAILKIQDAKDLPTVVLGNSDALEVGDAHLDQHGAGRAVHPGGLQLDAALGHGGPPSRRRLRAAHTLLVPGARGVRTGAVFALQEYPIGHLSPMRRGDPPRKPKARTQGRAELNGRPASGLVARGAVRVGRGRQHAAAVRAEPPIGDHRLLALGARD
jgi:hypothetical protein